MLSTPREKGKHLPVTRIVTANQIILYQQTQMLNDMNRNISCDLTVFTSDERANHETKSLSILMNAGRIQELSDGYSFYHDYSEETFISIAKWITGESKCCPFFTFELALESLEKGYEIALRLRGSKDIKQFLTSEFQRNGIKIT